MESSVKLPVRQLVEFILRGGSIDNRFGGIERAQEGARIHRKLQKAEGERYQPEVFLSMTCEWEGVSFMVEGRADGILTEADGRVIVDEIKTTLAPLEEITEAYNRMHWAQAMCYAYFYGVQQKLPEITVRLTYYQMESGEIKRFYRTFPIAQLKDFFETLLKKYKIWADWETEWKQKRDASIRELRFPFVSYRAGQRELAAAVYRTITSEGKLFCQAPTGIGKTMSTLFPSVKAIGEGKAEKVFYLTAKTVTRRAAEEALRQMREQPLRLKSVTLTAKDKICFLEERNCNPESCLYADGHFDRINDVLLGALERHDDFTREVIESLAQQARVCPFELSLDLALWCDCIVCDYNYLFDPTASLKRFFAESGGAYVFLVDEAHNLVDRARSMYSAELLKSSFLKLKKRLGKQEKALRGALQRVNAFLVSLRKECGEKHFMVSNEALEEWNVQLTALSSCCEEWLKGHRGSAEEREVLELYFAVLAYLKIADLYDECYTTTVETWKSEVKVKQLCLDPAKLLAEATGRGKATVFFSATLTPPGYFARVLGGGERCYYRQMESPFSQQRCCLLVADRVNTRYRARGESVLALSDYIFAMVSAKKGNYMVYFPSYLYMHMVCEMFQEQHPEIPVAIQASDMEESERENFLSRFQEREEETLVGFCVLGGLFSEGIDLKGRRLIGSIVVGVGLPQVNREQNLLRDYYNQANEGSGFDYAYRFPGMNKVLQAAGRVIRGPEDCGVVLLIDDRFTTAEYKSLFPKHWDHYRRVASPEQLKKEINFFWQKIDFPVDNRAEM